MFLERFDNTERGLVCQENDIITCCSRAKLDSSRIAWEVKRAYEDMQGRCRFGSLRYCRRVIRKIRADLPVRPDRERRQRRERGWGLLVIPFFLTTPVVFRVDRRFFTGAIKATRQKTTGMNTLVTVGAFAAWFDSSLAILIPCLTVMM